MTATTLPATCARCDAPDLEPTLAAALVELADADDMARAYEGLFPIATTMRLENGRYVWTDPAAERAWTGVCRRKALALDALLSHARAVRAAKGSST